MTAPLGDGAIVFDALTETAHRIDGLAAHVLDAVVRTGAVSRSDLVAAIVDGIGVEATRNDVAGAASVDIGVVRSGVDESLLALTELGLLGRTTTPDEPTGTLTPVITEPRQTWVTGRTHEYLDHRLAFCGPDPDLIAEIDADLGGPVQPVDASPTVHFGAVPKPDGRIDYFDTSHWDFSDRNQLRWQLPGALNTFMARSERLVVLHAGAVRTPDGAVVAVTGPIDAGKSTLIAALIVAG